jgi:hypothetical protein
MHQVGFRVTLKVTNAVCAEIFEGLQHTALMKPNVPVCALFLLKVNRIKDKQH